MSNFEDWIAGVPENAPFKFAFHDEDVYRKVGKKWRLVEFCDDCGVNIGLGNRRIYDDRFVLCNVCDGLRVTKTNAPH